jgi:hypothetical protein
MRERDYGLTLMGFHVVWDSQGFLVIDGALHTRYESYKLEVKLLVGIEVVPGLSFEL